MGCCSYIVGQGEQNQLELMGSAKQTDEGPVFTFGNDFTNVYLPSSPESFSMEDMPLPSLKSDIGSEEKDTARVLEQKSKRAKFKFVDTGEFEVTDRT